MLLNLNNHILESYIKKAAKRNGIYVLKAAENLQDENREKWRKINPGDDIFDLECHFCGSFLPYGQNLAPESNGIEGGKEFKRSHVLLGQIRKIFHAEQLTTLAWRRFCVKT